MKALLPIALLAAASALPAWADERAGPSFDCAQANTAATTLICSSRDLSRTELAYVQAYYALRQQLGGAGARALKQEAIDFEQRVLADCGVPLVEGLPKNAASLAICMAGRYAEQRERWIYRLGGSAAEEARRPVEANIRLQRTLQELNYLPLTAKIDGVFGGATRTAIAAWQGAQKREITSFLSDADAVALGLPQAERTVPASAYEQAVAAFNKGDFLTALRLARPLAEAGNAEAQLQVARIYGDGLGVTTDYEEALKWYRLAAGQGSSAAQYALGEAFEHGQGVQQDYEEAARWYQRAREAAEQAATPASNSSLGPPAAQSTLTIGAGAAAADASPQEYLNALRDAILRHLIYPAAAQGAAGIAKYELVVDRRGVLLGTRLVRSTGSTVLDRAAFEAIGDAFPFSEVPAAVTGDKIGLLLTLYVGPEQRPAAQGAKGG